jgi:hypothetical protein
MAKQAIKERKTTLSADLLAQFTTMYTDPDISMDEMSDFFSKAPGTLYRWGFEYGLHRPKAHDALKLNLDLVKKYCMKVSEELPTLPALKVTAPAHIGRTSIDHILWLCDLHTGRITPSYNAAVFGKRMEVLGQRIIDRARRLSPAFQPGKLHIFSLGDLVTGEQVGHQVTFEELEHAILAQVYGIAIPRLCSFTGQLLHYFGLIDVDAVYGNHGKTQHPQISAANWDTVVNLGWQAKMSNVKEVTFDVETVEWYQFATVKGIDWLLTHGDAVRGGNPYGALATKANQWHQSLPQHFDKVACGHFHHWNKIQEVYIGGTLLTDDDWSRKVVGRDGDCCQLLMAVSDGGIEAITPIYVDDVTEEDVDA